jgi:formate hydrogenlyase subunit 3/multisubunit Na+/H+ antiporter MnhD subunit
VTGTPPFSLFQSEFTALSAGLAGGNIIAATLFIIGVVTIFVGFLVHMTNLNLGPGTEERTPGAEGRWQLGAMLSVAVVICLLGFWLPGMIYELVRASARLLGGNV